VCIFFSRHLREEASAHCKVKSLVRRLFLDFESTIVLYRQIGVYVVEARPNVALTFRVMEAVRFSLVPTYQATRSHKSEDHNMNLHRSGNLRS
jgi:hypothetical protein